MSCSTLIRKSEDNYKLVRKVVEALSTKYEFNLEEGWAVVCDSAFNKLDHKFRRERRRNNPYSQVKKPRTAFSFYTAAQRATVAEQNQNASFGDISKLVAQQWKALSDKQKSKYRDMETADKERYQTDREKVRLELEAAGPVEETTEEPTTTEETPAPETPAPTKSGKGKGKRSSTKGKSGKGSKTAAPETPAEPSEPTTESTPAPTKAKASGYTAFQKKMRPQLKKENSGASTKELNGLLKTAWEALSTEQQATYA